ncbi:MAG: amidohydrolase family protein [Litorimonas sp.]
MTGLTIDSHQHFWTLSAPWCHWPTPAEAPIWRNFGPEDLQLRLDANGVDKTLLVQASPDIDATRALLSIAGRTSFVAGVVGWVDFENPAQAAKDVADLATDTYLVGIRPMLQSIEQTDWILRPEFDVVFQSMLSNRLVFDALIFVHHIPVITELAARYPDLNIIIDHAAKPEIAARNLKPWATDLEKASQRPNIACKFSGLLTEAKRGDGSEALQPYADVIQTAFEPDRILWGSDWPVVRMNGSYADWLAMARELFESYSPSEKAAIFGGNAARIYNPPL